MAKRMILMLVVVALAITALGVFKFNQIQTAMAEGAAFQPPPEAVTTVVAEQQRWSTTLSAIGTAVAVQGVTVSADLPGVVEQIAFESGHKVRRGDVLARLDSRQEKAQLKAAESQLELAGLQRDRMQGLLAKGVTSQAEFDTAAAAFTQAEARVGEIRATIDRKAIRAPFSGLLGIRQVNLGQYLNAGDPVVSLQSLDPIYVEFAVPQQQAKGLATGTPVSVTGAGLSGEIRGTVTAVNSVFDPGTRNILLQATFANPEGTLSPGMFLEVEAMLGEGATIVPLPASAIAYAPYGNSVYLVEEMEGPDGASYRGVRQQFVEVGPARGDQVAIVKGLEAGAEVVTSGVFKLRNGAAVFVNNEVQPANDPAARPENS
jgi:membrane fusion protein, multidrug efflux system